MSESISYIVVDIGKTLSKVTAWTKGGTLVDRQARPNERAQLEGVRRLDIGGIGGWLREALARYRGAPVEAIIPVAHGAGVVAMDPAGKGALFPP